MKNVVLTIAAIAVTVSAFTFLGADLKAPKIGENVQTFSLKNYDGKEFALDNLLKENKFVVAMFISTQCPVSNAYNERMEKLNEEYAKKGVAFVGINANVKETAADIAAHSKEHGFTFPVLKDINNKIADAYGAEHTPEVYVINAKGALVYHGRIDDSKDASKIQSKDLAITLDALLAGKEPPKTETKAFGCSIKRVEAD
ncbi:MAG TPA: thioredoxin family protein [Bacteroidota bacterium]|nr:thioredoxin family protein [Bacteroidota bacterium]